MKKYKRYLVPAIAVAVALWAFDQYVVLPICMPFGKPVTMYLEWNEKQQALGTPKRITFRIPSAYLLPMNSPSSRGEGYHESISFNIDSKQSQPACLLPQRDEWVRKREAIKIPVSIRPSIPDAVLNIRDLTCTKYQAIDSDIPGFMAYRSHNHVECYIPIKQPSSPLFFRCGITNAPPLLGCESVVEYKNVQVAYQLRSNKLAQWPEIQAKVFKKIDDFVVDIKR